MNYTYISVSEAIIMAGFMMLFVFLVLVFLFITVKGVVSLIPSVSNTKEKKTD